MSFKEKLWDELKSLIQAFLYFAAWLGVLVIIKKLILDQYHIEFQGMSAALVGALVLSKVVLILENVSSGRWLQRQAAWVEVVLRTALYSFGVVGVLLLEKGFEGRHEYGGFVPSLRSVFQHADISHVWVNAICVGGALLSYNVLWAVRRHLGHGGLWRLLMAPLPPREQETAHE